MSVHGDRTTGLVRDAAVDVRCSSRRRLGVQLIWVCRGRFIATARGIQIPSVLMSIGIGSLHQQHARGVRGAVQQAERFTRTPKYHMRETRRVGREEVRQSVTVQPLIELALGLYFTSTVFDALANEITARAVPRVFQIGSYTGLLPSSRVLGRFRGRDRRSRAGPSGFMKSKAPSCESRPTPPLDIDRL